MTVEWGPTSIYHIFRKQTMSSPKFSDSDSEPETSNLDQRASRKRKSGCEDDVDVGKPASQPANESGSPGKPGHSDNIKKLRQRVLMIKE